MWILSSDVEDITNFESLELYLFAENHICLKSINDSYKVFTPPRFYSSRNMTDPLVLLPSSKLFSNMSHTRATYVFNPFDTTSTEVSYVFEPMKTIMDVQHFPWVELSLSVTFENLTIFEHLEFSI